MVTQIKRSTRRRAAELILELRSIEESDNIDLAPSPSKNGTRLPPHLVRKAIRRAFPFSSHRAADLKAATEFVYDAQSAPSEPEALRAIGGLLWTLKMREKALQYYRLAAAKSPEPSYRFDLVQALLTDDSPDEAEPILRSLINCEGSIGVRARRELGLLVVGPREKANLLISILPQCPEVVTDLNMALLSLRAYETLEEVLSREVARRNPDAPILLGNLFEDHLSNLDKAEYWFTQGDLQGDAHSTYNLARLLYASGRVREGKRYLRKAARRGDQMARDRLLKLKEGSQ